MAAHYGRHLERLQRGEYLEGNAVLALCERVKDLLVEDDNVVHVSSPVAVCGDIHGQFHDLLELFKLSGQAPATSYVFLGDFVDRGAMSIETISLLCVLKASYPDRVTLLRGNHESRQTTQVYGFQIECMKKYDGDARIYKAFMELFDFLPLGALIDDSLLCLHGGLSPALHHLDQLRMLNRFQEIPPDGIFADIVWSDPDAKTLGFHMVRLALRRRRRRGLNVPCCGGCCSRREERATSSERTWWTSSCT
jgi:predicted phosphodiesterase